MLLGAFQIELVSVWPIMSDVEKSTTFRDGEHNSSDPKLEHAGTHGTYLASDELASISEEHRQYLLAKHGTLELDPVPSMSDADPYNWPRWKVRYSRRPPPAQLTDNITESNQLDIGRVPRPHVDFHGLGYHSSLRKHS